MLINFENWSAHTIIGVSFQEPLSEPIVETLIVLLLEIIAIFTNTIHATLKFFQRFRNFLVFLRHSSGSTLIKNRKEGVYTVFKLKALLIQLPLPGKN